MKLSSCKLAFVLVLSTAFCSTAAFADQWIGGNANWGNVFPTVPGWSTATAPNGVGAVAEKTDAASGTATIDAGFGPVTLGRITMGGSSAFSFGVTPTAGLTLDQDGAGIGVATINNTNTSGGSTAVILNAGTVTLADDLLISNTSNSIRTTGAVIISGTLTGTVGSVTIENVTNTFPVSNTSFAGAIRIMTATNTYVAPVTVTKGLLTYNNATVFGDAGNAVTIGQAGAGLGATVLSTAAVVVPNNITIAAGTGGTTILGSDSTSTTTTALGYSGNILLNGNLTTTGASLIGTGPNFSGNISGAGGLTHFGNAAGGFGNATLSGTNTYGGTTTITNGNLQFAQQASLYNGASGSWTDTNLIVNAGGVATFYVGGAGEFTATDIDTLKVLGTASGGFKNGSGIGFNTSSGNFAYASNIANTNSGANSLGLVKYGANTLTLSGTNTYTGVTVVAQGTLQLAKQVSFYNNTPASWTATNLTVNAGTTAAFNVGGTGEFTASDIQTISALGTATGGFLGTNVAAATASNLGFDTTNAGGGVFAYGNNIANPNAGQNPIGITKVGANTLELTGNNTYTGNTIVDGGTLRLNGGSHVIDPVNLTPAQVVVTNEIGNYSIGSVAGATGNLIVDGTNITSDAGIMVGERGTGSMTLNSGTVIVKADDQAGGGGGFLGIGRFPGSSGTYTQNGGELRVGATGNSDWFVIGVQSAGTATLNSGAIKAVRFEMAQTQVVNQPAPSGSFTMNGGTVDVVGSVAIIGDVGHADYTQTGGTFTVANAGQRFSLGEAVAGSATFNMSGGSIAVPNDWFIVARNGAATGTLSGTGAISCGGVAMFSEFATANSTFNMQGGTINAGNWFVAGQGTSTFNQSGGAITSVGFAVLARSATGNGTWNMSGGSFTNTSDLNIGDFGVGLFEQTGGDVTAGNFIVAYQGSASGTANINTTTGTITTTATGGFYVGLNGVATMNLTNGTLAATNASGDFRIGNNATGNGTMNMMGGSVTIADQSYVGLSGIGVMNYSAGTWSAGDNLWIGVNATGVGTMTMTGGTMTIVGNDPSYTGNLVMGRDGNGTLMMQGGLIDMVVTGYPTLNSLSYSIANSAVANLYDLAQDGNVIIGERTGSATVTQSAGTIKVAANVLVGGINTVDSALDTTSSGSLTITGGQMLVGVTSASGGDLVLGGNGASALATGTVSLQGGLLDVSNGSGKIGAALGTTSFTFTGGTLKAKVYNAGDFGGNLGNLVQNGVGSLLDVTGNSTTVQSSYDLGDGTATIGAGRTLSAVSVLNSGGAGVINVGSGAAAAPGDYNMNGIVDAADVVLWRKNPGAYGGNPNGYNVWRANFGATSAGPGNLTAGAGTIAVDTLNLNEGIVTAGGGVTIATALKGNGTINNDTVMGASASVSPGLSAGALNFGDDLTLGGSGTLTIEIGGATPVTQFDKINVANILSVGGTLQVNLINSYVPTVGQAFDILDFGSLSGLFSSVPSPANWDTTDLYTMGVIKFVAPGAGSSLDGGAVPEPTALALLAMAACGLIGRRRTRSGS